MRVADYLESGQGAANDRFSDAGCNSCSLLHYAAAGGGVRVIEFLLRKGADINELNGFDETPLHLACRNRQNAMVELLLSHGAKPSLSKRDSSGATPLHFAASTMIMKTSGWKYAGAIGSVYAPTTREIKPSEELIEILLQAGADPNIPTNRGNTPLHTAAYQGHLKVVMLLLANGANPLLKNDEGETAETLAQKFGQNEVVQQLRQHVQK